MTEEELRQEIATFLRDFSELESVKNYVRLKKAVKEDIHLKQLEEKRITLQKGLKYMKDEKKDACMKACKELQIEHDNDPLYVNYLAAKKDVLSLLSYLDNIVL